MKQTTFKTIVAKAEIAQNKQIPPFATILSALLYYDSLTYRSFPYILLKGFKVVCSSFAQSGKWLKGWFCTWYIDPIYTINVSLDA